MSRIHDVLEDIINDLDFNVFLPCRGGSRLFERGVYKYFGRGAGAALGPCRGSRGANPPGRKRISAILEALEFILIAQEDQFSKLKKKLTQSLLTTLLEDIFFLYFLQTNLT